MPGIALAVCLFLGAEAAGAQLGVARSSVAVDGHSLIIWTAGEARQGVPAVVFSSGFGVDAITWADVQGDIATLTKTIAYDRSGVAASQPSPRPRTIQNLADEMHALLAAARVSPPYILVGHSYGGPIIHTFAARYPKEVAGMVYIDPTDFTQTRDDMCAIAKAGRVADCGVLSKLTEQMLHGAPPGLVAEAREINRAEAEGFAAFRADGDPPRVPTAVLLAGKFQPLPAGVTFPGDVDRWFKAYLDQRMAHFSVLVERLPQSALVLTSASDHCVHCSEPELATWAIRRVLSATTAYAELEGLVGEYAFAPTVSMMITRSGGKLFVQMTGQARIALTQDSPTDFSVPAVGAHLEFEVDSTGKAASVTLLQNGVRQTARRK